MKLIIFSTRTKHHYYFIQKIYDNFDIQQIIYEKRKLEPAYKTGPFFEVQEDEYENRFFDRAHGHCNKEIPALLEKKSVDLYNVNQMGVKEYIETLSPDLVWVYGTGRIEPEIISIPKWGMVNLHGGISQKFRGLDSSLWALYNNDFESLGLTIHYIEPDLDTGDILSQHKMDIELGDEIFHLRYKMTLMATKYSLSLLNKFQQKNGPLSATPQKPGAYYSAMPIRKKKQSLINFQNYIKEISINVNRN